MRHYLRVTEEAGQPHQPAASSPPGSGVSCCPDDTPSPDGIRSPVPSITPTEVAEGQFPAEPAPQGNEAPPACWWG